MMRMKDVVALVVALVSVAAMLVVVDAGQGGVVGLSPMVTLANGGQVQGFEMANPSAYAFYGVPYSLPPVGDLRFQPPVAAPAWNGVFNATSIKPGCPQFCALPPLGCPVNQSEDCLGLNIYTPLGGLSGNLVPVAVFFPGGHFEQGTIGSVLYSAELPSNRSNVVIVEVAYRLGALGWLRTKDGVTGHLGLQDQRLALQWIQANIASFGGDPNQVTIWGQSAGATSVFTHLISPLSAGLFHRAIPQSHPWTLMLKSANEAEALGSKFLSLVSCDSGSNFNETLACLQQVDVNSLVVAQHEIDKTFSYLAPIRAFYPWTPVADGSDEVPGQPIDLIPAGQYTKVPVLSGNVANESTIFIYQGFPNPIGEAEYYALLYDVFKEHAPAVIERYPPHMYDKNDTRLAIAWMVTHWVFQCPNRYIARAISNYNSNYVYWFNHIWSFAVQGWGPNYTYCFDTVCHGSELPFNFHAGNDPSLPTLTEDEVILSNSMIDFWNNFVWSGDVNSPAPTVDYWKPYNGTTDTLNVLITPQDYSDVGFYDEICDFWDTIGYNHWG